MSDITPSGEDEAVTPKPDEPEPKRQHKTSVVRKIFGRSADLRPRKCSWVDQEKVCNPSLLSGERGFGLT